MNDSQWDEKLKSFLKKTGEDVKRAGAEIKVEAEKLLKEVKDPERQAKVKAGMKEFGGWARKTAEEMATLMETGVKKAEVAINKATDKVVDFAERKTAPGPGEAPIPDPAPTPANAAPPAGAAETPKPAKKSIGGPRKKGAGKKPPTAKKSIGKPPKPDEPIS